MLAAVALFVWSMIAHLPPIGTAGERSLSGAGSDAALRALGAVMHERAVYILPGFDGGSNDRDAWLAKFAAGPAAVVVYNPHPFEHVIAGKPFPTWLGFEFASDLAAALLASVIATKLSQHIGYWPRVAVFAMIGLIATIDVEVGYWNWYAFPAAYLLAQLVDHAGGWFLAGLVFARATPEETGA
jgi:hypothetical protein